MGAESSKRPSGVLSRLMAAGLLPRKPLGQHFLHDPKLPVMEERDKDAGLRHWGRRMGLLILILFRKPAALVF